MPGTPRTDPNVPSSSIWLPPGVFDGEALVRPWMKDPRRWQPGRCKSRHPLPRQVCLLAAPPQPSALLGNGVMHALTQPFLDLPQLRAHPVSSCFALKLERSAPGLSTDEREPRKVKVSGLPSPRRWRGTAAWRPNSSSDFNDSCVQKSLTRNLASRCHTTLFSVQN